MSASGLNLGIFTISMCAFGFEESNSNAQQAGIVHLMSCCSDEYREARADLTFYVERNGSNWTILLHLRPFRSGA